MGGRGTQVGGNFRRSLRNVWEQAIPANSGNEARGCSGGNKREKVDSATWVGKISGPRGTVPGVKQSGKGFNG